MMNRGFAEPLGITLDPKRTTHFKGISGPSVSTLIAEVTLRVQHFDRAITIPVAFIDSENVGILLGQEGFFDHYRIKFEKDHDAFEVLLSPKVKR